MGKEERMFPPRIQPEDCAKHLLFVIGGPLARRPTRRAFLVGEMNGKPVGILIPHPGLGEGRVGPIPKPGHIPGKHVIGAFTLSDPLGGHQPHATGLRKAGDDAVAAEVVAELRMGPKEHIAVR